MGFADKAKAMLGGNAAKAKGLLKKNQQQVASGIDKAADVADAKTKGKYSGKIDTGATKAKDTLSKLAGKDAGGETGAPGDTTAPGDPGDPPPASPTTPPAPPAT